jgi:adenylate cyclase
VGVLFADIVGFTGMAETMAPEAVLALLREFHARMTAQIFACGGTVDKYIGDAIVAVFGVPVASSSDAANALACAGKMIDALERWNEDRVRAADPKLAMGIGVNYGPAVLGDVGSKYSMSFTVIGDTVNTAARFQTLTRTLGTPLVVGDALVTAVKALSPDGFSELMEEMENQGEHDLRGRTGQVRIWTRRTNGAKNGSPFQ